MKSFIILTAVLLCSIVVKAEDSDKELLEYTQAVESAQKDLTNAQTRQGLVLSSQEAKDADAQVKALSGSAADQEQIYKIAAQVLGEIKGKDSGNLQQALAKAKADPQAFIKTLSPELQKQIGDIASSIEKKQKKP